MDFVMVGLSAALLGWAPVLLVRWIRAGASPAPPIELRVLLLLSLSIAVIDLGAMAFAPGARESFIRQFGDLGIPSVVLATALTAQFVERSSGRRWVLIGVMMLVALLQWFAPTDPSGGGDGPTRGVVGLVFSLLWVGVLLSPRVKRYCSMPRTEALA